MATPNFSLLDSRLGDRVLDGAAVAGLITASPTAFNTFMAAPPAIGGTTPAAGGFTNLTTNGVTVNTMQTLAAAGATQGNAGVIVKSSVLVTVTASTQGVRLPASATLGAEHTVWADPAIGVKVYPPTGEQIEAVATNVAVALVKAKASIFKKMTATKWRMLAGA